MKNNKRKDDLRIDPITQDMLVCKDCIFRYDEKIHAGNVSKCEIYPDVKPVKIINEGSCSEYVKD